MSDPKTATNATVDRPAEGLVALSHRIHRAPELAFEKVRATVISDLPDRKGETE
jgi:metal-dependent amidase/aminoacylase/carboxypeptidase family protein